MGCGSSSSAGVRDTAAWDTTDGRPQEQLQPIVVQAPDSKAAATADAKKTGGTVVLVGARQTRQSTCEETEAAPASPAAVVGAPAPSSPPAEQVQSVAPITLPPVDTDGGSSGIVTIEEAEPATPTAAATATFATPGVLKKATLRRPSATAAAHTINEASPMQPGGRRISRPSTPISRVGRSSVSQLAGQGQAGLQGTAPPSPSGFPPQLEDPLGWAVAPNAAVFQTLPVAALVIAGSASAVAPNNRIARRRTGNITLFDTIEEGRLAAEPRQAQESAIPGFDTNLSPRTRTGLHASSSSFGAAGALGQLRSSRRSTAGGTAAGGWSSGGSQAGSLERSSSLHRLPEAGDLNAAAGSGARRRGGGGELTDSSICENTPLEQQQQQPAASHSSGKLDGGGRSRRGGASGPGSSFILSSPSNNSSSGSALSDAQLRELRDKPWLWTDPEFFSSHLEQTFEHYATAIPLASSTSLSSSGSGSGAAPSVAAGGVISTSSSPQLPSITLLQLPSSSSSLLTLPPNDLSPSSNSTHSSSMLGSVVFAAASTAGPVPSITHASALPVPSFSSSSSSASSPSPATSLTSFLPSIHQSDRLVWGQLLLLARDCVTRLFLLARKEVRRTQPECCVGLEDHSNIGSSVASSSPRGSGSNGTSATSVWDKKSWALVEQCVPGHGLEASSVQLVALYLLHALARTRPGSVGRREFSLLFPQAHQALLTPIWGPQLDGLTPSQVAHLQLARKKLLQSCYKLKLDELLKAVPSSSPSGSTPSSATSPSRPSGAIVNASGLLAIQSPLGVSSQQHSQFLGEGLSAVLTAVTSPGSSTAVEEFQADSASPEYIQPQHEQEQQREWGSAGSGRLSKKPSAVRA